jgi:hypothetical protein
VNQLARRHHDEVRALLDAGDRLRAAQQAALRGEAEELRTATADERKLLRSLTQRGQELLRETGHSADPKRIVGTLRAAAVDPAGRELLEQGRLSEDLEASGFDAFAGMEFPSSSKPEGKGPKRPSPATQRRRQERLRKLRENVTKAKKDAAKAERAAARAEASLAEARQNAVRTNEALQHAQTELEDAEAE